jgi:hypothetical protein
MVGQNMKKLLIKLLLLLAITVLIGKIVISKEHQEREFQEEEFMEEIDDFLILSDTYIFAQSNPVYIKSTTLGAKGPESGYMELIRQYEWNIEDAYKIMMQESSGKSDAHNFSHETKDDSHGLFQINTYGRLASERPTREWLIIPENNIEYAYNLYVSEGRRFGTKGGWYTSAKKLGIY